MNQFVPFNFDAGDAALLLAAGYTYQFIPADWEDVGGPESGPDLQGHEDLDVYTLDAGPYKEHTVVIVDGMVVQAEYTPKPPPDWFQDEPIQPGELVRLFREAAGITG